MHKQYDGDIYNAPAMQAALGIYSRHGCAESPPEIPAGGCGLTDRSRRILLQRLSELQQLSEGDDTE